MTDVLAGALIGAVLLLAIGLCLVRMVKGPSAIDRAISNEVLVSTLVCAVGVEAALNRHATTLPVLLTLSLLGFTGSVAVARFVARDRDGVQLGGGDVLPESDPQGER